MTAETMNRDATQMLAAYNMFAAKPGANVKLADLRNMIDLSDGQMLAAVAELTRAGYRVYLEPEPKQRTLTHEDRLAQLAVGGEYKHLIAIE